MPNLPPAEPEAFPSVLILPPRLRMAASTLPLTETSPVSVLISTSAPAPTAPISALKPITDDQLPPARLLPSLSPLKMIVLAPPSTKSCPPKLQQVWHILQVCPVLTFMILPHQRL